MKIVLGASYCWNRVKPVYWKLLWYNNRKALYTDGRRNEVVCMWEEGIGGPQLMREYADIRK